ncbi:hypothetical protein [Streptomyces chromofuscus]|uniref:hypothetical protein n=1 Tax=Streptomyces chromofuscus TaxID=42881 RepID=UPI001679EF23|nr:hypothetical protein [Streptomyces chromofuscus]
MGSTRPPVPGTSRPACPCGRRGLVAAQHVGVGRECAGAGRRPPARRSGFRITLVGYWPIGRPPAWLFGHLVDLEAAGVRLGLLTGLAATAVLLRRYNETLSLRSASRP